jgi:uncharacterized protein DUF4412
MRFRILSSLAVPVGFMVVACKSSSPTVPGDASGGAAAAPNEGPAVAGLAFLAGFEGQIDAQFTKGRSGETPTAVAALLKSGKFRFDIPDKLTESEQGQHFFGPKAYGVFDSTAKKLSVVSDAKKQVIVIDMNKSGDRFNDVSHRRPPGPGSKPEEREKKIDKTGKFETVAGRKCEDWDVSSDHREATVCVTHDGISWFSLPAAALPTEHAWALELMDGKHFPMKFVGYDKDGMTEDSRFEITKMEKRSVPDSAFEVPADFKVMDLDQLMQGLAGLRGAMAGAMGAGPAANAGGAGATPGAAGTAPAMPPGMPSNIPGLTPEQMQQIQQRLQQMQQRRPH